MIREHGHMIWEHGLMVWRAWSHDLGARSGEHSHMIRELVSQATPLRRERKGLVTLQLPSCRRGMQLLTIAVR